MYIYNLQLQYKTCYSQLINYCKYLRCAMQLYVKSHYALTELHSPNQSAMSVELSFVEHANITEVLSLTVSFARSPTRDRTLPLTTVSPLPAPFDRIGRSRER